MSAPTRRSALCAAALALGMLAGCATAPVPPAEPTTVRVNIFRTSSNIHLFMAMERGSFARHGIRPEIQFTPNSTAQRKGLAAGSFEIAHAAVDNAVAMIEVAKHDVVIVSGGDGGMNWVLVRPEITSIAQLRGRTYVVDAPNTAYALIGRKILKDAGLVDGKDYKLDPLGGADLRIKAFDTPDGAATLLNPPWSNILRERGARSLGRTIDLFGPYQAGGMFVMRPWAKANEGLLVRYLAAYIEGCRAVQDPANRAQTVALLQKVFALSPRIAEETYTELLTPGHGMSKDCAFDLPGFRNVLALRAEMEGQWGGKPPAPDRFIDLTYFERAMRIARR